MRLKIDQQADAIYLRLDESAIVESEEVRLGFVLDYNADNRMVGMEILNFRKTVTDQDLLRFYAGTMHELLSRGVIRSWNNPLSDLTERLVTKTLTLKPAKNATKGFDAQDSEGVRYQIKGRRITQENRSTQLSAIRNLDSKEFDYLVAVLFDEYFDVIRAHRIPWEIVFRRTTFQQHVNAFRLMVPESISEEDGVEDVTGKIKSCWSKINSSDSSDSIAVAD